MTRGIYTITNTKTGKTYVGQSSNIENRWGMHKTQLNNKSHSNYKLLKDWCKYGPEVFKFKVVEEVLEGEINEREELWIDLFEGHVYNLVRGEHPTKKVPTLVDGLQEFDSYGAAASWYGVSVWCVRTGVRKNQEVDCGHSKHTFRKQNDNFSTLWSFEGFEVYSFEDTEEPLYEPEADYIKEELMKKCWEAAEECLTEEEYLLFYAHFALDVKQKVLAESLDMTQSAVSKKIQGFCQRVRKHVFNKKWQL